MTDYGNYRKTVLNIIEASDIPLGIESIRKESGIKVWETAKAILLELVFEGKIAAMKTGKSWVFGKPSAMSVFMLKRQNEQEGGDC